MSSLQTPLHQVQGLGAAHSGTGHFWRLRVTAVALIPLSLWFVFVVLGLAGASEVAAVSFLAHPWNALLMGAFVSFSLYHAALGLQEVVDDYVHTPGAKIFVMLFIRAALLACWAVSAFALIRIASL